MIMVLPFRLRSTWFGMELDKVLGVEICGKISLMPNAKAPLVGLMQKEGKILPVWSLNILVQGHANEIKTYSHYIELQINEKITALPVEEVLSVVNIENGWVASPIYGLKIHRSLDKKTPSKNEIVQEIKNTSTFYHETNISQFPIEEISPKIYSL